MVYEMVLDRIQERRQALGLSERQLLSKAGVGEKALYHLRIGHAPKPATLQKIAAVLGLPTPFLLDAATKTDTKSGEPSAAAMDVVFVQGAVQAGVWHAALEWDASDWYGVTVPQSRKHPGRQRFGLEVRGTSMDRHYPDGTVVLVIKFDAIGRLPRPGDHVVVLQRSRNGAEWEATLKEYDRDAGGRHLLWPRSTDPDFQVPIIIAADELPVSDGSEPVPLQVTADDASGDLIISALVVGAYREL